jgi:hypothetical protein
MHRRSVLNYHGMSILDSLRIVQADHPNPAEGRKLFHTQSLDMGLLG